MPSMLAWTAEEDALLRSLIQEHGTKKWSLIASIIQSKSSKQCRRRWKNSVDMEAKATSWTPSEDAQLVKYHRELGNKWTQISKRFGDRTDNAVKNRWHALCKKQPELAEEESPITTVGVRRGTRTRQFADEDDEEYEDEFSDGFSEEGGKQRARKRPRRGAGPAAGSGRGSGGTSRATASLNEGSAGRQPSRLGPYRAGGGSASGLTGGGGGGRRQSDIGIDLLPTPFDQIASRRGGAVGGAPGETLPVSIVVPPGTLTQQELLMAQQLNAKGAPFQIEVAELPREGSMALNALLSSGIDWIPDSLRLSDGSGSGGQIGTQGGGSGAAGGGRGRGRGRAVVQNGALPAGISLNAHLSGAVGGFGGTIAATTNTMSNAATNTTAAANINSSLSINDLLNWLNSATAELPAGVARDLPGIEVAGGSIAKNNNNNNSNLNGRESNESEKLSARRSKVDNSGSLHPSLSSGSSGLSSGQRDLLARLFSQVRDSAELRQQQWQQQLGNAASNGNDALMMFLDQQQPSGAGVGGTANELQRMLSLGLGNQRSLSLGFGAAAAAGMGSLPLGLSGSLHSNPSGKTRSSSDRVTSAFTEAADAAIAAVDNEIRNKEAALAAAAMAEALVRQHSSGRSLRRGGGLSGGPVGDGGAIGSRGGTGRGRAGLSDIPVIAPQYSAQDIDTLLGALAVPKAR